MISHRYNRLRKRKEGEQIGKRDRIENRTAKLFAKRVADIKVVGRARNKKRSKAEIFLLSDSKLKLEFVKARGAIMRTNYEKRIFLLFQGNR